MIGAAIRGGESCVGCGMRYLNLARLNVEKWEAVKKGALCKCKRYEEEQERRKEHGRVESCKTVRGAKRVRNRCEGLSPAALFQARIRDWRCT